MVAGSVGKTSTKTAIATVLAEKYRVQYQTGNYNHVLSTALVYFGLPMPELRSPLAWLQTLGKTEQIIKNGYGYDVVVLEIGTDAPGDLAQFKGYLQADIGVVTAITPEHMEFFGHLDAVAKEEFEVAGLSRLLILNSDDVATDYRKLYAPTALTTSLGGPADFRGKLETPKHLKATSKFELISGKTHIKANIAAISTHSAEAYLLAGAIGLLCELTPDQVASGLSKVTPVSGRMTILEGHKDSLIIDDTYNASPAAVIAALGSLYSLPSTQRIAILGSMNELGSSSKAAHEEVGEYCDPKKLKLVVTIGRDAKNYLAPKAETRGCKVKSFDSPYAAGKFVETLLKKDTLVLAKGSQNGVFAEEAVKQLLANTEDYGKLVRQSSVWMAKKQQQFSDAG